MTLQRHTTESEPAAEPRADAVLPRCSAATRGAGLLGEGAMMMNAVIEAVRRELGTPSDGSLPGWANELYGPDARAARARIVGVIIGGAVNVSDKRVGWQSFRGLLSAAVGVTSCTCIANQEKQIQAAIVAGVPATAEEAELFDTSAM